MSCCGKCEAELQPGELQCGDCGEPCDPDRARGFKVKRRVERGDTIVVDYDLLDSRNVPIDVSDPAVKVWFTVKYYLSDADQFALAQATLLNGGIVARDAPASGHVRATIQPTVTQSIREGTTKLYYDLQVKDAGGRISTVEKGIFLVDPDVTRATG